jgi:hypothetical protein
MCRRGWHACLKNDVTDVSSQTHMTTRTPKCKNSAQRSQGNTRSTTYSTSDNFWGSGRQNCFVCISCCQIAIISRLFSFFYITLTAHSYSHAWRILGIILEVDRFNSDRPTQSRQRTVCYGIKLLQIKLEMYRQAYLWTRLARMSKKE